MSLTQIILYGGARRMPEQAGIHLKGLNIDKLKAEYQELKSLNRKQENLNQYLGRTEPPKNAQEQPDQNNNPAR